MYRSVIVIVLSLTALALIANRRAVAATSCTGSCHGFGAIYSGDVSCYPNTPPNNPYPGACKGSLPPGCSSYSGGWSCMTVEATAPCQPDGSGSCKCPLPYDHWQTSGCN
jgi:hypothetical protein